MIDAKFHWDWSMFKGRMDCVRDVIDHARIMAGRLAERAYGMIKAFTPETSKGRTKIKELWDMDHSRRGTIETYIIKNLYPKKDIILFFEEGTRPHIIRPIRAKSLRWVDEMTGEEVFAQMVRHPGTPAYEMIAKTEKLMLPQIDGYVAATLKDLDKCSRG